MDRMADKILLEPVPRGSIFPVILHRSSFPLALSLNIKMSLNPGIYLCSSSWPCLPTCVTSSRRHAFTCNPRGITNLPLDIDVWRNKTVRTEPTVISPRPAYFLAQAIITWMKEWWKGKRGDNRCSGRVVGTMMYSGPLSSNRFLWWMTRKLP